MSKTRGFTMDALMLACAIIIIATIFAPALQAADPDVAFRTAVRAVVNSNGTVRVESLPAYVRDVATNNASTRIFTNVVWDLGATTGTWTFVNGRLITP